WGYGPISSNNGNVLSASIVNSGSGLSTSQTFAYDLVNRLVVAAEGASGAVTSSTVCTANTGTWCRNYGYDAWGNGWVPYNFGLTLSPFTPVASTNFNSINRLLIDGAAYDNGLPNGAGNQTAIGGYSNTFDAEKRMVSSTIGSATAAYTYDGDGRRVQKASGGTTTTYVYDAAGRLAAEYAQGSVPPAPCTTCYLTADHLGSTRLVTRQDGTTAGCHDYLPCGEEIPAGTGPRGSCYGAADDVNQKFTGKERDVETGLDYFGARYLSSAQGRFTIPDWSGRQD